MPAATSDTQPNPDAPETALAGVRILDLTRVLAGPFCTMMLSDLGADVLKVENPDGGDETRAYRPAGSEQESSYFLAVNRNKRSLAIDITQPEGAIAVRALAAKCDVVVESMRTGAIERYGLGYETLAAGNPRLIFGSISGYGRTGLLANRGGYDPIAQAESGVMAMTGDPDGPPTRMGVSLMDVMAGQYLAQAILAALIARDRTGKGQRIDVPLYDSSLSVILPYVSRYLLEGTDETRVGNSSLVAQPLNVYQASDGPFVLCAAGDRMWRRLAETSVGRDLRHRHHRRVVGPIAPGRYSRRPDPHPGRSGRVFRDQGAGHGRLRTARHSGRRAHRALRHHHDRHADPRAGRGTAARPAFAGDFAGRGGVC